MCCASKAGSVDRIRRYRPMHTLSTYGITGDALSWIVSYLSDRTQRIAIGSTQSNSLQLNNALPQRSVLGPRKYCKFSKSIGETSRRHGMSYHCYAVGTQVYLVIKPRDIWNDIAQTLVLLIRYQQMDETQSIGVEPGQDRPHYCCASTSIARVYMLPTTI